MLRRGEGGFGMRLSPIVVRTQQRRQRQQHSGEVSQVGGQGPNSEEGAPMVNLHTLLEVSDVLRDLPAARGGVAARDVLLEVRGAHVRRRGAGGAAELILLLSSAVLLWLGGASTDIANRAVDLLCLVGARLG
jgi:hypothetical protein